MTCKNETVAIIPARAGSKRLPRKNVLPLAGKPMICWTIEAAINTGIRNIVVSTDDPEVMQIASSYPTVRCLERPAQLATDTANTMDVLFDVLDRSYGIGHCKNVMWLQPTSPLRNADNISEALKFFEFKSACAVVSVTQCEHSPLWSNTLPEDHAMQAFLRPEVLGKRSQDLPCFFRLNGAIYIANIEKLRRYRSFFQVPDVFAFEMSNLHSVDVDKQLDFDFAQFLLTKSKEYSSQF
uniref:N-Acetylneuraminate cytidylyltransferase n=1 Tax=Rheinheimera sp. BAL341 TaxID=1708203 RepID=A0A486XVV3_9GAMM